MMTVRVLKEFRDKDNFARVYAVGEVLPFDKARSKDLISRGLVESYKAEERPRRIKTVEE